MDRIPTANGNSHKPPGPEPHGPPGPPGLPQAKSYAAYYFSQLLKRRICAGKIKNRIGRLTDLVFKLAEPYPEAVGIYVEHGWGQPTEFIPWDKVVKIEDDAIFVQPNEAGQPYPPFVDQPGWMLVNEHLMGRTIFDMDGRRTEVVNDAHLLESKGRMLMVHVDISFNGFLRRWGLGRLHWLKDKLISWRYVQPFSIEDAAATDAVSLSITRRQIQELPSEDLADALEQLGVQEQQAFFSALDSEKAAETLMEAEPRAQRQIIANLRQERARTILSEISVPQLADLFSVLPHDDMTDLMGLLPKDLGDRVRSILSDREAPARMLLSKDYVSAGKESKAGEVLEGLRHSHRDHSAVSYVYVLNEEKTLLGVADLRELVVVDDNVALGEIMSSPVVSAEADDNRDDLAEMFAKYHFRMVPVVDAEDHMLGVIHYNDIMKGLVTRAKT